jgi:hypothetical protein
MATRGTSDEILAAQAIGLIDTTRKKIIPTIA